MPTPETVFALPAARSAKAAPELLEGVAAADVTDAVDREAAVDRAAAVDRYVAMTRATRELVMLR